MNRPMRWVVGLVALAVAGGAGGAAWMRARAEHPVEVTGVTVSRGTIQSFVKATGIVDAPQEYAIAAPQSARLQSLPYQVGNVVKRGERVAQLDAAPALERLSNAKALVTAQESQVHQAELDLKAEESIWRAGGQTRHAVDQAQSRLAQERAHREAAESDVRAARILQDAYGVLAPADGVVTAVTANPGEFVQAGMPLLSIASQAALEVQIKVDEGSADQVRVGQAVELSTDDQPNVVGHTSISRIEPKMQKDGTSYYLVARAPLPAGGLSVRLNQQLTARILSASRTGALRVPLDAVTEKDGADVVRVIVDGRLRLQPVHTGIQDGHQIEILDGLAEGRQVVFGNAGKPLPEGTLVRLAETRRP